MGGDTNGGGLSNRMENDSMDEKKQRNIDSSQTTSDLRDALDPWEIYRLSLNYSLDKYDTDWINSTASKYLEDIKKYKNLNTTEEETIKKGFFDGARFGLYYQKTFKDAMTIGIMERNSFFYASKDHEVWERIHYIKMHAFDEGCRFVYTGEYLIK